MIESPAVYSPVNIRDLIFMFDFPAILYRSFNPDYDGWDYTRIHVDEAVSYDR
jgi:hypothetical protein